MPPPPATTGRTAPAVPPLWPRHLASRGSPRRAGLGSSGSLAARPRVPPPGRGQGKRPDASTTTRPAPFVGLHVASQRRAHRLECLAHPSPRGGKWTALGVVAHAPNRRAIPEPNLSRLIRDARCAKHRPTRGVQGAGRAAPAPSAPCTGRGRRHGGEVCLRRLGCRARCQGSGVTTLLQHPSFHGAPPSHCAPPLALRTPVPLQHRLRHSTETVVVALAMREALQLGCARLDEGLVLVRPPSPHGLVPGLRPLPGQRQQAPPRLGCPRKPGRRTPPPLAHQRAHHV